MFAVGWLLASLLCSISDGVSESCHDCEAEHAGLVQVNVKNAATTTTTTYILQVYCGDSWLTTCDQVPSGWQQHPGAFQPDIEYTPILPATSDSDPDKNYLTFGGGDVEGTLTASFIIEQMPLANCNNVDYDMEGSIAGDNGGYATVQALSQTVAQTYPDAKFQVTCLVNDYTDAEAVMDTFSLFGIMIHGSSMVSGHYSIPEDDPESGGTWTYIHHWIKSDIPNNQIILSLTTVGLEGYMINWFKTLIAEYGLAGMSFWYWNQLPSYITVECIEDMNVECVNTSSTTTTSGSGSSCSAYCTGGPDDGQCCDKDSTTTTGSCTTLGQEGCCGGTSDTTYCQLADDPGPITTKKPKPKYRRRKHYRKHHRRRY